MTNIQKIMEEYKLDLMKFADSDYFGEEDCLKKNNEFTKLQTC